MSSAAGKGRKRDGKRIENTSEMLQHHIELFNHMGIQRETVFLEKFYTTCRKIFDLIFSKSDFDISRRTVRETKSNVIN